MTLMRRVPRAGGGSQVPRQPLAIGWLLLASAILGAGCRPSSSEGIPEGTEAPPAVTPDETARPPEKADPEKDLGQELTRILGASTPPSKKLELLKLLLRNAKSAEAGADHRLAVVGKIERESQQLEQALGKEADGEIAKIEQNLKPLLGGAGADLTAAGSLIDSFPVDRYKGTAAAAKIDALKARIITYQRAEMEYGLRQGKLGEDSVKNIALLEGFDPAYAGTPSFDEVQRLIKENYKKYVELREAKVAKEVRAKWDEFDIRDHVLLWPKEFDASSVKEGELTIGPNLEGYIKQNPKMADEAGILLSFGDDKWIDVEIRFEAQVTEGKDIFFGARGNLGPDEVYNFSWQGLGGLEINDQEWHPMVVRIEGMQMEITATGLKSVQNDRVRLHPGPFGVRVTGAKAVFKLRKMQVWVINQEGPPPGKEEEKGAKKKGSAKKSSGK